MRVVLEIPDQAASERCMAPMVDRPFLHHMMEMLKSVDASEIYLAVGAGASSPLGEETGERWGLQISVHHKTVGRRLADAIQGGSEQPTLVGNCNCLPNLLSVTDLHSALLDNPFWISWKPAVGIDHRWTGWYGAGFSPDNVRGPNPPPSFRELTVSGCLFASPSSALFESALKVIRGEFPSTPLSGREYAEDVRVGWAAKVAASVKFKGPVFVGERTRIGPSCEIGPNVVIGAGCVIGEHCRISNAVIQPGTYVAPDLKLKDALTAGELLTDLGTGVQSNLGAAYLLGNLSS